MNLRRTIDSLLMEARQFTRRAYPDFVVSPRPRPLGTGRVPVFMLHTVQPAAFEAQLRHLHRNGYRTLDCTEFLAFLRGEGEPDRPSVLLTFDDGERSLYRVAHPLLQQYGMKAVNFIVPGRILEPGDSRPETGKQWLNWDEVRAMHRAGTIDFQSHTQWHERMFVGNEPIDFWRPELFTDGLLVDRPRVRQGNAFTLLDLPGAPVYAMAPRMMDQPKFIDREELRTACANHVREHGGMAFFTRPRWRRELTEVWRHNAAALGGGGRFESPAEQEAAILESLVESRRLLEDRLQREVRHLAYPWASGGHLAAKASRQAGYWTNFHGPIEGIPCNVPGGDPYRIPRIKDDYIHRLPGDGRLALWNIMTMKSARRIASDDIY